MNKTSARFLLMAVIAFVATHLQAQTPNGLITGTITDSSGNVVPGARIDARDSRGVPRTATSKPETFQGIHKIRHVIIIMQENRSFDSYFGTFLIAEKFTGI